MLWQAEEVLKFNVLIGIGYIKTPDQLSHPAEAATVARRARARHRELRCASRRLRRLRSVQCARRRRRRAVAAFVAAESRRAVRRRELERVVPSSLPAAVAAGTYSRLRGALCRCHRNSSDSRRAATTAWRRMALCNGGARGGAAGAAGGARCDRHRRVLLSTLLLKVCTSVHSTQFVCSMRTLCVLFRYKHTLCTL